MNKRAMKTLLFVAIAAVAVCICGCGRESGDKDYDFYIYYIDDEGTGLCSQPYTPIGEDKNAIVEEVIEKLSKDGSKKGCNSAIPDGVLAQNFAIDGDMVSVDFNGEYRELDTLREVLCRAAVVITLTQIDGVDSVSFTVDEKLYQKADGEYAQAMSASDFVSDISGDDNAFLTDDFKLYFANEDGTMLKEYNIFEANYDGMTREEFIVNTLIQGPKKTGYSATMSEDVEALRIVTVNNICYVDFSENFALEQGDIQNEITIYSIVDSLLELSDIHKVQISINGDSTVKYHDDISLTDPFIRNLDIIEDDTKNK